MITSRKRSVFTEATTAALLLLLLLLLPVPTSSPLPTAAAMTSGSTFHSAPLSTVPKVPWTLSRQSLSMADQWNATGQIKTRAKYLWRTSMDEPQTRSPTADNGAEGSTRTMQMHHVNGQWSPTSKVPASLDDSTGMPRKYRGEIVSSGQFDGTGASSLPFPWIITASSGEEPGCPVLLPILANDDPASPGPTPINSVTVSMVCSLVCFMFLCFEFLISCARAMRRLWISFDGLHVEINLKPDGTSPKRYYSGLGRPEKEALEEGLKVLGFGLVNVIGDGNCLFRSVSHQLYGDEKRYRSTRACAVKTLRAFPEIFMPFVGGGHRAYKAHVRTMASNKTWGTEVEVAALCKGLGRSVRVWRANPQTGEIDNYCHEVGEQDDAADDFIDIAFYNDGKHYLSVVPLDEDVTGCDAAIEWVCSRTAEAVAGG